MELAQRTPLRGREQRLNSFATVGPGQTARVTTRLGLLHKTALIQFAGVTLEEIEEITIKVNDDLVLQRISGVQADVLAFFDGAPDATESGVIVIPFTRRKLKMSEGEALTGINVGVPDASGRIVESLSIEVKLADTAAAPELTAYVDVSDPVITGEGPGLVLRRYAYTKTGLVAGINTIDNLATLGQANSTRLAINRIMLNVDPLAVTRVALKLNGREEIVTNPVINEVLQIMGERFPVAGWTMIDPSKDGLSKNWIELGAGLEEFMLEFTLAADAAIPDVLPYIVEYIGLVEG